LGRTGRTLRIMDTAGALAVNSKPAMSLANHTFPPVPFDRLTSRLPARHRTALAPDGFLCTFVATRCDVS
jgi:hypothetical protein